MPPKLSTHVLDTANGCPAANMRIDLLEHCEDGQIKLLKSIVTNGDGRNGEGPLISAEEMRMGKFQLHFYVGDYFRSKNNPPPPMVSGLTFLDVVPVAFGISDATQGYHVPLLCSPWAYSTYRGS